MTSMNKEKAVRAIDSAPDEMRAGITALVRTAIQSAKIRDASGYTEAVLLLREQVKPAQKRLKAFRETMLAPLRAVVDAQRSTLDALAAPLVEAESILKTGILDWEEQEAARLAREEELAREDAEAAARAAQEAEAQKFRDMGDEQTAREILEIEIPVVPPVIEPAKRPAGVSVPERWDARVSDLRALCAAIAKGDMPLNAVEASMPVLRGLARKVGQETTMHGVEFVKTRRVSVR